MASNCPAGITLTAVHGGTLYWDKKGNDHITGAYLGYQVTNTTGSSITGVSVDTDLGTTGNAAIKLGGGQPDSESLGSIPTGESAMAYFLVDVKQGVGTESVLTTLNYNSTSCSLSETINTAAKRALAANANKLFTAKVVANTSGTTGTAPEILKFGSFATVVVTGNTGTIGSGPLANREVNLTPVVYPGLFAADAWKLVDVSFKSANSSCGVSGLIANRIHFSSATSPSSAGCGGLYSASFTFQSREVTKSSVSQVQAFSYIASGNLIKHTSPLGNTI
jgi:YD repeat-containing protein